MNKKNLCNTNILEIIQVNQLTYNFEKVYLLYPYLL